MNKGITRTFNAALFGYFCYVHLVLFLFKPRHPRNAPWNTIYESSPVLAVLLALLLAVVLFLGGAFVVREFWNRWVVQTFNFRQITYDESLAIVLILSLW